MGLQLHFRMQHLLWFVLMDYLLKNRTVCNLRSPGSRPFSLWIVESRHTEDRCYAAILQESLSPVLLASISWTGLCFCFLNTFYFKLKARIYKNASSLLCYVESSVCCLAPEQAISAPGTLTLVFNVSPGSSLTVFSCPLNSTESASLPSLWQWSHGWEPLSW